MDEKPPASFVQTEPLPSTSNNTDAGKNFFPVSQPKNCLVTLISSGQAHKKGVLLATARVIIVAPNGFKFSARALLDNCSQTSIISEFACQQLRLKGKTVNLPVSGAGGQAVFTAKKSTRFSIQPHFQSNYFCEVEALVTPKVAAYSPPKVSNAVSFKYLDELELADPNFLDHSQIDVQLDANVYAQIQLGEIVKGEVDEPVAVKSTLG